MKKLLVAASTAAVLLVSISDASARSARVNQVPNGLENSCQTCHTNAFPRVGNGPLNEFGTDVEANLTGGGAVNTQDVDWPAVCDLDSDGDGATNGTELGDPNCEWTTGDDAGEYLSHPGDASSVPDTGGEDAGEMDAGGDTGVGEDAGDEDDAGTGMDAGGGDDIGDDGGGNGGGDEEGCSTTGANAPVSALVALLGLLFASSRRRRS